MKKVDIESVIAEINEALDAEQETDDTEQDTDDAVIHFETLIESGDFLDWGQIFSIINNTMRVDIGFNQSHWERILLAHATGHTLSEQGHQILAYLEEQDPQLAAEVTNRLRLTFGIWCGSPDAREL